MKLPALAIMMTLLTACADRPEAQLLIYNGHIHLMDSTAGTVEALAVGDGRILAAGSTEDLKTQYTFLEEVDLQNRHVFPGFIDAHAHLHSLGEQQLIVDLIGSTDPADILSKIREAAASGDGWIRGRGWDQNDWPEKRFPDRSALDSICPDRPVFLVRIDGHAAWVNSAALETAGINRSTPDPPGGRFLRRPDGSLSGVLLDNAVDVVRTSIPPPSGEEIEHALQLSVARCNAVGLTGIHDMGMRREQEEVLRDLASRDLLPLRIVAYIDGRGSYWDGHLEHGREIVGEHNLVIAGLKLYADGALGSRGAYLLRDYLDDSGNRGLRLIDEDTIVTEVRRAVARDMQVCVHAIGDAGNRLVLDAYARALKGLSPPAYPLRVEHAQTLSPDDIPRFARLGVLPSMQPTHCTSDMRWAEARLGHERMAGAYAWRSLLNTGVIIPGGSDFPIESPDPLRGIYAAAFRMDADGKPSNEADIRASFSTGDGDPALADRYTDGWYGSEAMTREEAVLAFTRWAASAAGCQDVQGTLLPGRYADFVVLSQDILTIPRERFLATTVLQTWVGGKKVFEKSDSM